MPSLRARGGPAVGGQGTPAPAEIDLAEIRERLAAGQGPAFWKSLDAVAGTPAFRRFLEREYPSAAHLAAGPDRRGFFKIMAASLAMSGLAACDSIEDGRRYEVPYVRQPERIEPGKPLLYASTALIDGFANGILVSTVDGRPIKIEGNPRHPWSLGGTDTFGQASVLGLYDPLRSQTVRFLNRIADWDTFRNRLLGPVARHRDAKGKGLYLLTGPTTSPSTIAQIQAILKTMPEARWAMASPLGGAALETASRAAFGVRVDTQWHFDKAKVIVSFDGDVLDAGPGQVGTSRRYAAARAASATAGRLLTLHAAGSTPSLTSAKADYHLVVEPQDLPALVDRLAAAVSGAVPDPHAGPAGDPHGDKPSVWVRRAAQALVEAKGESIVLAGAAQPAILQEAVHRLNAVLGNLGTTVTFTAPVLPQTDTIDTLAGAMAAGDVDTLLMFDINPVYEAPGAYGFAALLSKVATKVHAGTYVNETALRCDWHLPLAHPLESWGDARAVDGTASLIQPTIRPFYEGRTVSEILSLLFEDQARDGLTIVKSFWQGSADAASFDAKWRKALIDGFLPDTASTTMPVAVTPASRPPTGTPRDIQPDRYIILFRPDASIRDSDHAANGWLQELPKPLTKVVWDNVVAISPDAAEAMKIATGDVVAVAFNDIRVEGAAWIQPGQAERTLTLTIGYGRTLPDALFDGLGYNANPLRSKDAPWMTQGATLAKTGRTATLATTQDQNTMEGHDFIRVSRPGDKPQRGDPTKHSLYGAIDSPSAMKTPDVSDEPRAWGMVIDTDACTGCNACVVSCQAENNIAIVGKEQIALGRDMHWLRIDRYYSSAKIAGQGLQDPDTHFQPVPCMHCELAPCEVGCPVEATLHDQEGLNLMVYNRCVGTRACSGYCPYKVRRFNYLDYTGGQAPSIQARNNPEVTVRARGVMEKCTYCIQRIAEARIDSDKTNTPIADGTVKTACQTACPTQAISFGNLADEKAEVVARRGDPRNYDLLGELNVRPRTTYLAERAPATSREG